MQKSRSQFLFPVRFKPPSLLYYPLYLFEIVPETHEKNSVNPKYNTNMSVTKVFKNSRKNGKMNFAAIMKDEVNRKRKKLQTDLKVDDKQKKYFKRSELERVEREKYEERMGMKKVAPSVDRIAEWEAKTQVC